MSGTDWRDALAARLDEEARSAYAPGAADAGDPDAHVARCAARCEAIAERRPAHGGLETLVPSVGAEQLAMVRGLLAAVGLPPEGLRALSVVLAGYGGPAGSRASPAHVALHLARPLERSLVARAVPARLGRAAALWARLSTLDLGRRALLVFAGTPPAATDPDPSDAEIALAQRLVLLANLAKTEGVPTERDRALLCTLLEAAALPDEAAVVLRASFATARQHPADFDALRAVGEPLPLLIDLVAFAGRAGSSRPAEREYLRRVAERVGVPPGLLGDPG